MIKTLSFRTIIALAILTFCGAAMMDTWAPQRPRIFASRLGWYGLKAIPVYDSRQRATTHLHLFQLDESGKEEVLWSTRIKGYPRAIAIGDNARVVLFDCGKMAMVVLASDGRVASQYELEDLLTPEEMKLHEVATRGAYLWRSPGLRVEFSESHATVTLSWGKIIYIDLKTGRVARAARP